MKSILAVALLCLAPLSATAAEQGFPFFEPVQPPRPFQVMVHRGLAQQAPENTRRAIEMCIEDGLEWVEIDVRLTKDGQHALFHDSKLDGKTSGTGTVKQHTLAELKQLDAGGWFAKRFAGQKLLSIDECFALVKGKINLYLDCKDINPELLVNEIKAAGVERQVVVFDSLDQLRRVQAASGGTVAVMPKWHPKNGFGKWLDDLRPAAVEIDADETTPEICREFRARGIKVQAKVLGQWDNPKFWDKVLADGVDYLQTDLPDEVIAHVMDQKIKPRPVRMACHRGASRYAPENTLPAFEKAYRLKADFVEFDVRPSRDGKFFLLHDGQLNRTTTGQGPIKEASSETIESLDAGSWFGRPFGGVHVPSLDQFLAAVPKDVNLYFDAKDIPPEAFAAAIEKYGLAERTVVYQGAGYLEKLKQIDSRIRTMPGAGSEAQVTSLAAGLKPYAVDSRWNALSKQYIAHCHAAGIQVFADAPGNIDVAGYRKAIDWGIDLIQTDHPIRLWRAMELVAAERAKH
ncbi:MAG: glycerophosphodiester phosphodiesterase family protein [Planctomycetia bacterium]|nr:glycerophosphodiester phosphodiesterase family protein [Planctomycetia bacterium]